MTLAGLILAVIVSLGDTDRFAFGGRVALLKVEGLIADDEEFLEQLRRFRRDASVKGFVLAINSPGGVVGPSQSLYREVRKLREEDDRPIIASIGAVGASGGYYVALAADSIFALPGSITGSIGVIMEFPDVSGLLGKVGVEVAVVKSAEHKDIGSPFRHLSPEDRQIIGALVEDVYQQFVEVVVQERRLPPAEVQSIADGRILSGRQALQHGLVDRIGNVQDAVAAVGRMTGLGEDPRVVRPKEEEFTLLDLLLGRGAAAVLSRVAQPLEEHAGPRLKFVVPH
ncbi:MAG: signal peptide peptidase SppA [Gemmatimonadetes bacterium]|nr:signal peptide peptidase SppA [Gemmatimonadota bacterium]